MRRHAQLTLGDAPAPLQTRIGQGRLAWTGRLIASGLLLLSMVAAFLATRPADGDFAAITDDLALGRARQHTPSGADFVARVVTRAVAAAAGSASDLPEVLAAVQETAPEEALLELVNQERAVNGMAPVAFDPLILGVARARAAAQLPEGPLSHYNALGELAFIGLLAESGVDYSLAGENLARSTSNDGTVVQRLHQALMNSPTHRANVLEQSYTFLAVGAASDASGRIAFAQIFRAPVAAAPAPTAMPGVSGGLT